MPTPKLRNGNVYVEGASFSKTHGATPAQCKVKFEALCNITPGTEFLLGIHGSYWLGRVLDSHVHKSEGVGRITEITCNDVRELLMSQSVFCQLNQIDRKTGQIYCILGYEFVDALVALGYITQAEADDEYGKWGYLKAFGVWSTIYPQTVLNVLCYLGGFDQPYYSAQARQILNATATALNSGVQATLQATNNFFGIDWHSGEKVGTALQHVADLMGLQFTLVPGSYRLSFFKIGEPSYQGIEWQGIYAGESNTGTALQTQVDTGVWITGERDIWELDKVDLEPAWNQTWNRWALLGETFIYEYIFKPVGLDLLGTTIGDLKDLYTVVNVRYFYAGSDLKDHSASFGLDLSTLYDDGFTDAGYFEDLSIHDYLERVVFKVYRIAIMDEFLTEDEYNGRDADGNRVPVRFKPIHTPLLSDPSVPYHCYGTIVNKKCKRHRLEVSLPRMRREKGHRLSDETGHIAFDTMQYTLTAEAQSYSEANQGNLLPNLQAPAIPTNIAPDAPAIDVCFYGPVFRNFYGMNQPFVDTTSGQRITVMPRIGNKKVSGLRHGKVLPDAAIIGGLTPWERVNQTVQEYMTAWPEYLLNPDMELTAETEAQLVAAAWLNRPHVVSSGEESFFGFCGHEPDGEIRRVTVTLDNSRGVSESVAYANDYPSPFHEPDIELTRQMGVDRALREAHKLKTQQLYAQYKQQNEAEAKDEAKGEGLGVTHQKRVIVNNHLEVGLAE